MTTEARVYRCSACGAPAKEGSRQCSYCLAPVATVRCARCFHMNSFESRYCSGCGVELGLEPPECPSAFRCPGCKVELVALQSGSGSVLDCPRCGGQFVGLRTLRELLQRKPGSRGVTSGATERVENPLRAPIVYRACPSCAALMHRKNFGGRSGIIVDVCSSHGTWFDAEELPRVLAFVERGGLERAERLEVAERRGTLHETRAVQLQSSSARSISGTEELLLDAVVELFAFVIERLVD